MAPDPLNSERGTSNESPDERASVVRYTLSGAAFLLRVPPSTIRSWANGYTSKNKWGQIAKHGPVLRSDRSEPMLFGFLELIELLYVRALVYPRKDAAGKTIKPYATLRQVRDMADFLEPKLGEYPFARAKLAEVLGQVVSPEIEEGLFTNVAFAQHLLYFADELVKNLEFDRDIVSKWYLDSGKVVRVDPNLRWGVPTIPSGISCESVYERYMAEDLDVVATAEWFEIEDVDEVRAAVKFWEDWPSQKTA